MCVCMYVYIMYNVCMYVCMYNVCVYGMWPSERCGSESLQLNVCFNFAKVEKLHRTLCHYDSVGVIHGQM